MSNNLSDILRGYVSKEKQKNPYLNETGISKKMDIPPTTFNRLVNGHSKPAVKTLLKLSHFIPELKSLLPEELVKVFKVSNNVLLTPVGALSPCRVHISKLVGVFMEQYEPLPNNANLLLLLGLIIKPDVLIVLTGCL